MISVVDQQPVSVCKQGFDWPLVRSEAASPQQAVNGRLGCTVKAVEARLYHGRKRLRAELERTLHSWRSRLAGPALSATPGGLPVMKTNHCLVFVRGRTASAV